MSGEQCDVERVGSVRHLVKDFEALRTPRSNMMLFCDDEPTPRHSRRPSICGSMDPGYIAAEFTPRHSRRPSIDGTMDSGKIAPESTPRHSRRPSVDGQGVQVKLIAEELAKALAQYTDGYSQERHHQGAGTISASPEAGAYTPRPGMVSEEIKKIELRAPQTPSLLAQDRSPSTPRLADCSPSTPQGRRLSVPWLSLSTISPTSTSDYLTVQEEPSAPSTPDSSSSFGSEAELETGPAEEAGAESEAESGSGFAAESDSPSKRSQPPPLFRKRLSLTNCFEFLRPCGIRWSRRTLDFHVPVPAFVG
jgi:hypothetical protein